MSKERTKKQIKQPTHEKTFLEEEINSFASKIQDLISQIESRDSSSTLPSDSQAIKSEITKQFRSFNERTKHKITAFQHRYEQDIKNQQIKNRQLTEQLKQQQETSQKEMKVRSDLVIRYETLYTQNKELIKDKETLENKKNGLKNIITKKDQLIDNLTEKIEQISNKYNRFIETNNQKIEQISNKYNDLISSIDDLKTENDELKDERNSNRYSIKKLLEEKSSNENNINLLNEENQNLKAENDSLKIENESNKSNINKLLEEKANNENNINLLKEENLNLKQNVDNLTDNLTEKKKLVSKQKNMINELQAKQNETMEDLAQMQRELQEMKISLNEKQNTLNSQSLKLAENEETISNLIKEKDEKIRDKKVLQVQYNELNQQYIELKNGYNSEISKLQESNKIMKQKIIDFEAAEKNRNIVKEMFNWPVFKDNNIRQYPEEEVFIPQQLAQESVQIIDYYDEIIPSIIFHFDKEPEEFDFDYFNEILKESSDGNAIIINVDKGSTIINVALAVFINDEDIIKEKLGIIVDCVKDKINTPMGKAVIGNLVDEPTIKIPDDKKIIELCAKPSLNLLQNTEELNEKINVDEIKKDVIKFTREMMANNYNWKYIFSHQTMFDQMEMQVRMDIENNQFEITIVGQTLFANKIIDAEYEEIKKKIPSEDVKECYLYHGSRLNNHQKIIIKHFLMPGQDKMEEQLDKGYYGKGIYATENIFYAAMYSNGYKKLKINEKAYVLCCKAVYNKNIMKELYDLSYYGKDIDENIKNNYGINHAFVGDCNSFQPIKESDIENCYVYGQEFVFSNKFQLVPLCSFTIMRKDHCIIWKDENIENNENSAYMKELSKKMEINVYFRKSVDGALEMIKKKKRTKIKLITNGGIDLSGKILIEKARQIVGSNFVCLVFANSLDHMKWVSEMENVLFTKSPDDFRAFSELKMEKDIIMNFAHKLEEKHDYKFMINESQLLEFPFVKD